jgi:hypothetical protein
MSELFEHPEHIEPWEAAAQGEPVDWDEVFAGYRATVDWPGGAFYEELMERYPHAKVILTVRDPERWYESARTTIYGTQRVARSPIFPLMALFFPRMRQMKRAGRMIDAIAWEGMFDGRFEDKEHAIEAFERWNEEVKRRVPAERLLVYEVKQGWGPCASSSASQHRRASRSRTSTKRRSSERGSGGCARCPPPCPPSARSPSLPR